MVPHRYKKCLGTGSERLIKWQRPSKIHVSFRSAFPKRKLSTVDACQFGILLSMFDFFYFAAFMPEVLVFCLPRIVTVKKICIHL